MPSWDKGDCVNDKGTSQLYSIFDSLTGFTYRYSYDDLGRVIAGAMLDGTDVLLQTRQTYNANNQLTAQVLRIGDTAYTEYYTYDGRDGSLATYTAGNGHVLTVEYDTLRRVNGVNVPGLDRNYTYRDITETRTTSQIASLWYGDTKASAPYSYGYTYDSLGNIATYTENGTVYAYTYDPQGQLLTATGGNKTYAYTYDTVGNILTASDGTGSHTYSYTDPVWRDKLTAYDGHAFAYDAGGNPLSYYNGETYAFTWQNGRELASTAVGNTAVSYTYDLNGLRMSKTVNGELHTYYYMGDRLVQETYGSNTLEYYYDQTGRPYALDYNGTVYYYILNLQGDVMALVDANGTQVASYSYTPYGAVLTATGTMASINPLRYRGYYYDADTSLYYLQSRYYDPTLCRFLNADGYMSTGQGILGNNMFAYCRNSPVFRIDITGFLDFTCDLDGDADPLEDKHGVLGGGNGGAANTSRSISAGSSYSGSSSGGSKTGHSSSQSTNGNKVNVQMPNNSSKAITYGQGKAGKSGTGTYVQLSSDGRDAVISWTEYNQYSYPEYRVDLNHTHGGIGAPHMHRFETVCISGNFHLNKLPTIEVNLVRG